MSILILPTISSGNIPQLAIDLLIHTLDARFIRHLDDRYLYPFVGPRDTAQGRKFDLNTPPLSTPIEVYATPDEKIQFIQIRSPTLPGLQASFVSETLVKFINGGNFVEVIVAASSNAGMQFHIEAEQRLKFYSDSVSNRLLALSLEDKPAFLKTEPVPRELAESGFLIDILSSSGKLSIPISSLVLFAYEGDNFSDAELLAERIAGLANIARPAEWIRPESWQGVYGRDIPLGVEEGLYA